MRFPMSVPRSENALKPEIGARPAILLRCHRQRLLLVMHVDDRLECRPSYLSSAARLRHEARQWTSFRSLQELARLCLLLRSGGEKRGGPDPSRSHKQPKWLPLEPEKRGANVCESCRRVALRRATCCSAAHPARPPFSALPPCRYPTPTAAEPPFNTCLRHSGRSLVPYERDMFPARRSALSKDE